jgi:hypothetical protein
VASWVEHVRRRLSGEEEGVPWFIGDKIKAYELAQRNGVAVPTILKIFRRSEDFDPTGLPSVFVLKPTGMHSTQGVMPLRRRADGAFDDLLRKRKLTTDEIRREQAFWFERNRFKRSYRLFVEELLIGEDAQISIPKDYKLYCFYDSVELITQIDRNHKPPKLAWFVREFEPMDVADNLESEWRTIQPGEPELPWCHAEMVNVAKKLSAALPNAFREC